MSQAWTELLTLTSKTELAITAAGRGTIMSTAERKALLWWNLLMFLDGDGESRLGIPWMRQQAFVSVTSALTVCQSSLDCACVHV